MMDIIVTASRVLGIILLLSGVFFFIAATFGILRMPDPYNRGHVASKADSPGFILCLLGSWLYWVTINPLQSFKILLIIVFMLFANPIAIHSILRLCFRTGITPHPSTKIMPGSMTRNSPQKTKER
jgi:multicomponent Na+:H+ antiporter subunit G